jgi:hypothetical protein
MLNLKNEKGQTPLERQYLTSTSPVSHHGTSPVSHYGIARLSHHY